MPNKELLAEGLTDNHTGILEGWIAAQSREGVKRSDVLDEDEIRERSKRLIAILADAIHSADIDESLDIEESGWDPIKNFLRAEAEKREDAGISPTEAAGYIIALKEPVFDYLRKYQDSEGVDTVNTLLASSRIIDQLAIFTMETYLERRDAIIRRQQREMTELSTPVIQVWDRIVALPLIGTLDSERAQMVMENLLEAIITKEAEFAILDITGVPTVDTLVAQNLIKTASAARLMGAQCIICGIKPKIAQIIVQLGIDLPDIITRGDLQGALVYAFDKAGLSLVAKAQ